MQASSAALTPTQPAAADDAAEFVSAMRENRLSFGSLDGEESNSTPVVLDLSLIHI